MMITVYPEGCTSTEDDSTPPILSRVETSYGEMRTILPHSEATKIVYSRRRDTDEYFWQGDGPLSLKCWFTGQGLYEADGGRFAVTQGSYLLLNGGQRYSVSREREDEEESLLIFFAAGFAEEVYRSLATPFYRLLDEPWHRERSTARFYQRLYPHDPILWPRMNRLRLLLMDRKEEPGWIVEQLHGLLEGLLQVHRDVQKEVDQISACRPATREELYRRIHYARDYAAASLDRPLTLQEWAGVACLSPNHFLRTFKQIFHSTPHQYLTRLRLEKAQDLLRKTDRSVTEICFDVGFESLGSFSTLFRRHCGVSPQAYRLRHASARLSF